jgi:hypothetical protein
MSNTGAGGAAAGWYADPHGRHQSRYWDGMTWTAQVADNGVASVEGQAAAPPPPAAAQTPALPWPGLSAPGVASMSAGTPPPSMSPGAPAAPAAPAAWSPSGQVAPGAPFSPGGPGAGAPPSTSGGKAWFKKPLVWILAALVVAGGVVGAIVVLGSDDAPPALSEAAFHDQLAALCTATAGFNADSADPSDPAAQAKVVDSLIAEIERFSKEVGKLHPPSARAKALVAYQAQLTRIDKLFKDLKVQVVKQDQTKVDDITNTELPAAQAGLDQAASDLEVTECNLNA